MPMTLCSNGQIAGFEPQYGDDGPHLERYKKATGIEFFTTTLLTRCEYGWMA